MSMADLKSMSRKEKLQYIWDYYKLHIIGMTVLAAFVVSFIYGQVTKISYVGNVAILGDVLEDSKRVKLEKIITGLVVKEGEKRKQAFVEAYSMGKDQIGAQMMQKFMIKIAAGDIDVIVLDKELFEELVKQEIFLSIEKAKLEDSKLNKIELSLEGATNQVLAVSAEGSRLLESIGLDTRNKIIAMPRSSINKENGMKIFQEFIK
jgi:hypothetical protein